MLSIRVALVMISLHSNETLTKTRERGSNVIFGLLPANWGYWVWSSTTQYLISFSCFFFAQNHNDQQQQPKPLSWALAFIYLLKGPPEVQMSHRHRNYLQLQNRTPARANHGQLLWTVCGVVPAHLCPRVWPWDPGMLLFLEGSQEPYVEVSHIPHLGLKLNIAL